MLLKLTYVHVPDRKIFRGLRPLDPKGRGMEREEGRDGKGEGREEPSYPRAPI
jgi:hypothetical protein